MRITSGEVWIVSTLQPNGRPVIYYYDCDPRTKGWNDKAYIVGPIPWSVGRFQKR